MRNALCHPFLTNKSLGTPKFGRSQLIASLSAFQSPRPTCHTSAVFLFRIITVSLLSGGVALAGAHDRRGSIWEERNALPVDGHFFRLEGVVFCLECPVSLLLQFKSPFVLS